MAVKKKSEYYAQAELFHRDFLHSKEGSQKIKCHDPWFHALKNEHDGFFINTLLILSVKSSSAVHKMLMLWAVLFFIGIEACCRAPLTNEKGAQ
ncbi:MAG: hypothetical protein UDB11_03890 [Peptococcaceae bacterium]|nr:hypothetical protein [Peptococcaceae bacterium]